MSEFPGSFFQRVTRAGSCCWPCSFIARLLQTDAFLSSTSCPLPVPNIPPALSSFSHFCLPAQLSLRECCHWVNRAVLGGSFSVCHRRCGRRAELPNWAIKGYFHPRTSVSVGSSSKYRPGTSDAHEARLRFFSFLFFSPPPPILPPRLSHTHRFKSTYVIFPPTKRRWPYVTIWLHSGTDLCLSLLL